MPLITVMNGETFCVSGKVPARQSGADIKPLNDRP